MNDIENNGQVIKDTAAHDSRNKEQKKHEKQPAINKKTHKLHIYTAPDGTEIYRKDASKVNKINVINSEVLQIDKTNGLSDLISLFGENIDDVQVIDDNTEYICVRDKNNNEIYVDSYSLEAYQGNPYEE